jgi:hypothetical protein
LIPWCWLSLPDGLLLVPREASRTAPRLSNPRLPLQQRWDSGRLRHCGSAAHVASASRLGGAQVRQGSGHRETITC